MTIADAGSATVLSRIEDAGLNASAPPQQRWVDGWLVRFSAGKAKRARCINALADGRLRLEERLAACEPIYRGAGLPLVVRLTPFTRPEGLDLWLEARGFRAFDDTRVMVSEALPERAEPAPVGLALERVAHADFAEQVGALRGSPPRQRHAHAERLRSSPVPYEGWVLKRVDDGRVVVCAQTACEGDRVGLYDVFTDVDHRGRGLARWLCGQLLRQAGSAGARIAYLQVDAGNAAARAVYHRMGFRDGYAYHYRTLHDDVE